MLQGSGKARREGAHLVPPWIEEQGWEVQQGEGIQAGKGECPHTALYHQGWVPELEGGL